MSDLVDQTVNDPKLKSWVMPSFSTTTDNDRVIAFLLLMGITKNYFDYNFRMGCGLPSVTLLGEKADWKLVYKRIDKLKTYGDKPRYFCKLLKPFISRVVKSFDDPQSEDITDFWQRIKHYKTGNSGPSYYSGWITAFCVWKPSGVALCHILKSQSATQKLLAKIQKPLNCLKGPDNKPKEKTRKTTALVLDGARYHKVDDRFVPAGYTSAEVHVNDNGYEFDALMVAGSVGINVTTSGNEWMKETTILDTMSPLVSNFPLRLRIAPT